MTTELAPQTKSQETHKVTIATIEDELASGVTHGIGLALAIGGFCTLVILTAARGNVWTILGCTVYGVSLVVLYAASTLYHSAREPRRKEFYRKLDHVAIFLLIAGTYTPFTLVSLKPPWGWILFALVWSLAIAGIIAKIVWGDRWQWLSLFVFIALGWCGVVAVKPILESIPQQALLFLLAGGLSYTFGTVFFALDRIRYFHAIWHLFVIMGSVFHFLAVVFYVVPAI